MPMTPEKIREIINTTSVPGGKRSKMISFQTYNIAIEKVKCDIKDHHNNDHE